jgi:hypothetical protein
MLPIDGPWRMPRLVGVTVLIELLISYVAG